MGQSIHKMIVYYEGIYGIVDVEELFYLKFQGTSLFFLSFFSDHLNNTKGYSFFHKNHAVVFQNF